MEAQMVITDVQLETNGHWQIMARASTYSVAINAGVFIRKKTPSNHFTIQEQFHRVRVIPPLKGISIALLLYYGRISRLSWDPGRVTWAQGEPLMTYSTKLGRELMRKKRHAPNVVTTKSCHLGTRWHLS